MSPSRLLERIASVLFLVVIFVSFASTTPVSTGSLYNEVPHGERGNYADLVKYYPNMINGPPFANDYTQFHEELMLNQVEQDESFRAGVGVTKWYRLRIGDEFYLLGTTDSRVLNFVKIRRKYGNIFQGHLQEMEFEKNISTVAMFKLRSKGSFTYEGLVFVALPPPENAIMWYKIVDSKIEAVWNWKQDNEVRDIVPFTVGDLNRLLIIRKTPNNQLVASVYEFEMINEVPHYWLLENLPLRDSSTSPVVHALHDGTVYFSVVHEDTGSVRLFEYKKICQGGTVGNFQERFLLTDLGARSVVAFQDRKDSYIAVVGVNSTLFKLPRHHTGTIMSVAQFGELQDMIVVPVHSSRGDIVIFGKSKTGAARVFSRNAGWHEIQSPDCRRLNKSHDMTTCFGGANKWNGATYIDLGDFPSLLFPNREQSELYHLLFSLVPVLHRDSDGLNWISIIGNDIKLGWEDLNKAFLDFERMERDDSGESDEFPLEKVCTLESDLSRLVQLLVDTKLRLNSVDCSGNFNSTTETDPKWKLRYFIRAPLKRSRIHAKDDKYKKVTGSEEASIPNEIVPDIQTTDSATGLQSLDQQAYEMYRNLPSVSRGIAVIP